MFEAGFIGLNATIEQRQAELLHTAAQNVRRRLAAASLAGLLADKLGSFLLLLTARRPKTESAAQA